MPNAASSWAAALLSLAEKPTEAVRFGEVLNILAEAMTQDSELRSFLLDPTLPRAAQKDALEKLAGKKAPKPVLNFLGLLADKNRLSLLPEIAAVYERQRGTQSGACLVTVRTAEPLAAKDSQRIGQVFAANCGASCAMVQTRVDPALVGGVQVQAGEWLYDESLKGRMDGLRRAINARLGGSAAAECSE